VVMDQWSRCGLARTQRGRSDFDPRSTALCLVCFVFCANYRQTAELDSHFVETRAMDRILFCCDCSSDAFRSFVFAKSRAVYLLRAATMPDGDSIWRMSLKQTYYHYSPDAVLTRGISCGLLSVSVCLL